MEFNRFVGGFKGMYYQIQSPTLFIIFLERIMDDALENHVGTVRIGGRTVTNLRFADDIDGLAGSEQELAELVENIKIIWNGNQCRKDKNDDN